MEKNNKMYDKEEVMDCLKDYLFELGYNPKQAYEKILKLHKRIKKLESSDKKIELHKHDNKI